MMDSPLLRIVGWTGVESKDLEHHLSFSIIQNAAEKLCLFSSWAWWSVDDQAYPDWDKLTFVPHGEVQLDARSIPSNTMSRKKSWMINQTKSEFGTFHKITSPESLFKIFASRWLA